MVKKAGDSIEHPIHEYKHDPEALAKKAPHAEGRCYKLKVGGAHVLPASVDLRSKPYIPAVLDQGELGSCASNAMANALAFLLGKEGAPVIHASRLALYYNTRVDVEHEPADEDTGVAISDVCKSVAAYKACPESDWPYDISKFSQQPPKKAYSDSAKFTKVSYYPVTQTPVGLKTELSNGFPVLCGIQIYDSFESQAVADTGIVPLPGRDEQCLGGHAQLLMGYSDAKQGLPQHEQLGL